MLKDTGAFRWAAALTVLWLLFTSPPMRAQVSASPPPPAQGSTLENSVQALAGEVKELNATIQELRAEVSRSRQETSDLRTELHGALEKLSPSSLNASAGEKAAPGVSEAAGRNARTAAFRRTASNPD